MFKTRFYFFSIANNKYEMVVVTKSDGITSPATAECKPILCSSYDSDTSWRVRIASAWKGVDYKVRYVNMADSEHLCQNYAKINPCRKLPSFITKTGKVLTQNLPIIEYLEAMYPSKYKYCIQIMDAWINLHNFIERPMFPKSLLHRAEAFSITLDIACDIQPLQVKQALKFIGIDMAKREKFARNTIEAGFEGLERRLEGEDDRIFDSGLLGYLLRNVTM